MHKEHFMAQYGPEEHIAPALDSEYHDVRMAAARNASLHGKNLEHAMISSDVWVSKEATGHPNVTAKNLTNVLSSNTDHTVASRIFAHPKINSSHLDAAMDSADHRIRNAAVRSPLATGAHIDRALRDSHWMVRTSAIRKPEATKEQISVALKDPEESVRFFAVKHPSATRDQIKHALGDPDPDVQKMAKKRMDEHEQG